MMRDVKDNSRLFSRVVFWGNSGAGKTALLRRWTGERFRDGYSTTPFLDFYSISVAHDKIPLRLQLWDRTGPCKFDTVSARERIHQMTHCAKACRVVVLVIDLSDTFDDVVKWTNEWMCNFQRYVDNSEESVDMVVVGNKMDIRCTAKEEMQRLLARYVNLQHVCNTHYIETSAKFDSIANLQKIVCDICVYNLGFSTQEIV